jgi:hypothetical protein
MFPSGPVVIALGSAPPASEKSVTAPVMVTRRIHDALVDCPTIQRLPSGPLVIAKVP